MTVDIGSPDYEMKVAILQQKAEEMQIEVEPEGIDMIANGNHTNARELEGAFVRLASMASYDGRRMTGEMVQEAMGLPVSHSDLPKVRPVKVISTIAKYFDYKNKDILGQSRKADLVKARHITMYILRETLGIQLEKVGEIMGGRDHTTIIHAVDKMKLELQNNPSTRQKITLLEKAIYT
jgi:chromosomal replication initiator protein